MLTSLNNNRSLAFYQKSNKLSERNSSTAFSNGITSVAVADTATRIGGISAAFNKEYNGFIDILGTKRIQLENKVSQGLLTDNTYQGARNDGVNLAWEYEQADIKMGGDGSAHWNETQQQEILDTGKVRGAEGHHQKNVAAHPEHQANPDNIKFYEDRNSHLQEGHDGKWTNESDAPFIDKNEMLTKTNKRRVFRNELKGLGIAVALGVGIGFTISFVVELAQSGITPESVEKAVISGGKGGIETGLLGAAGYGIGRFASNTLQNLGIDIATKAGILYNMAAVGILSIAIFSTYQFIKLKLRGEETGKALMQVGRQAMFSLSLLAVTIIAQGVWGGYAGLIVSTSIGLVFITVSVISSVKQRKTEKMIREYTIEQYKPLIKI